MPKTVMLQSIEGMGAKLGKGMWAIDFQSNVFQPNDVVPNLAVGGNQPI